MTRPADSRAYFEAAVAAFPAAMERFEKSKVAWAEKVAHQQINEDKRESDSREQREIRDNRRGDPDGGSKQHSHNPCEGKIDQAQIVNSSPQSARHPRGSQLLPPASAASSIATAIGGTRIPRAIKVVVTQCISNHPRPAG